MIGNAFVGLAVVAGLVVQEPGSGLEQAAAGQQEATSAQAALAHFELRDVFELEHASDPRISPDGTQVVYARRFMDIMEDRQRSNLWIVNADGSEHRPLTTGNANDSSPRWSPDGKRLLYSSSADGSRQLYVRWMDSGQTSMISHLTSSAGSLSWSPDGKWIAFNSFVEDEVKPLAKMPSAPKGATWAPAAKVITQRRYRADGAGYLKQGRTHLFVLPAEGGTPRQLTSGGYDVGSAASWAPDGKALVFSANRREDADDQPLDSAVYEVSIEGGEPRQLTHRYGPDNGPLVAPDGKHIAYTGFDDLHRGFQVTQLYVMNRDGSEPRSLTPDLDRSIGNLRWAADGSGFYFSYADQGNTSVAYISLGESATTRLVSNVGGTSLGRPYSSGSFTVSNGGRIAFTHSTPARPSDVAVFTEGAAHPVLVTQLNEDLFGHKELGSVEELRFTSTHDGRALQGWIVKPPGFVETETYPMILEIHGGPFANYGDRFSAECQLYAAAGYVVLYMNPRGSTSYGGDFADQIHHAYPGHDYEDLMSGVDTLIEKGYVDPERLFVTGGSGGGVLTAWIVGKTERFQAAVVAKPVINWISFALTSDAYSYFHQYWFPGLPWEKASHYWERSPLSLVGNVTTPTMLLSGEADFRTPISEAEQFYQALQLNHVETAMVRIPEASHGITARPSNLIAKVAHILAWFEQHPGEEDPEEVEEAPEPAQPLEPAQPADGGQ